MAVGAPIPPLTVDVTVSGCVDVLLVGEGVTVTEGVAFVTVTEPVPVALVYVEELVDRLARSSRTRSLCRPAVFLPE